MSHGSEAGVEPEIVPELEPELVVIAVDSWSRRSRARAGRP